MYIYYYEIIIIMLIFKLLLFSLAFYLSNSSNDSEETVLYYYGLEESERSLSKCGPYQACSAFIKRFWRPAALVRLCRCGRRQRCDEPADTHSQRIIPINNRAYLQFCQAITNWPECSIEDKPLTVETTYDRMNPDDLEELHHKDIQLVPPKLTVKCKCQSPNYWKLNSTLDHVKIYECSFLPLCRTGEFCGNVNYDMNALYQSCLCPKHHICVHNGGIAHSHISEVLYDGLGWKAHCQKIDNEYDYEDYYAI